MTRIDIDTDLNRAFEKAFYWTETRIKPMGTVIDPPVDWHARYVDLEVKAINLELDLTAARDELAALRRILED